MELMQTFSSQRNFKRDIRAVAPRRACPPQKLRRVTERRSYSFRLTAKFSAKGRYRSGSARDRWLLASGTGELGTKRTLPVLRRVREFPYIGMELGVRQARQSVTG